MIILKGQVPHTTHSYTKHSHTKKKRVEKERQQKKAKYTSIKQRKAILALSCLIIYILFHPRSTKLIEDFETRKTVKFSLYKDYKASKGFGGTGE